jgi:hypothetical protein
MFSLGSNSPCPGYGAPLPRSNCSHRRSARDAAAESQRTGLHCSCELSLQRAQGTGLVVEPVEALLLGQCALHHALLAPGGSDGLALLTALQPHAHGGELPCRSRFVSSLVLSAGRRESQRRRCALCAQRRMVSHRTHISRRVPHSPSGSPAALLESKARVSLSTTSKRSMNGRYTKSTSEMELPIRYGPPLDSMVAHS